ncbi:MAG TPA: Gldg family protein [Candidatus Krumholzibacteria bacterium]|nr:Gldg family protein [Candidatus Krumholzibacteria bacterium]
MRAWWAVTRTEAGAFFHSAMAPLVAVGFLLLCGVAWIGALLDYAELSRSTLQSGRVASAALNVFDGVFQPYLATAAVFLLLVLPAVTMRLFAEEYRSRRADLIFTWPVPDHVWVLGKAASAWLVAVALLLAAAPYGVAIGVLGTVEPGPLLTSLLGLLLTAALAVSWGVFFSGAAGHQLVGWLLAFLFLMGLQSVANLEPHLPPALGGAARALSLPVHLERLTRGVLDLRDVIYFLGWTALGLAAATALLTGRRLAGARRGGRWLPVAALAVLFALAAQVAERAPASVDLTRDQRRSLAPQTVQVLRTLRADVHATAFYQRLDPRRFEVESMLESFARQAGGSFTFDMVNPDVDLGRVEALGVTSTRTVVVEAGGRRRTLPDPDELTLVNAAFRLAEGSAPTVAYLQGHGEPDPLGEDREGYRAALEAVGREGYRVVPLVLARDAVIPADIEVVIMAGPDVPLADAETAALHGFMARGGGVLALMDPGTPPGFADFLRAYNVVTPNTFLVDGARDGNGLTRDRRVIALGEYPRHDLTRGLQGLLTFFPFAQPLHPDAGGVQGVEAHSILMAGPDVWEETDPLQVRDDAMRFDVDEDRPGPLPLGVAVEVDRAAFFRSGRLSSLLDAGRGGDGDEYLVRTLRQLREQAVAPALAGSVLGRRPASRLVVIGDSDFAANASLNLYGNRDLLLNALGWLTGESELIGARARERASEPLLVSDTLKERLGWGGTVVWPLLVGLGLTAHVVLRRRR